jgi:hypothetical protein
VREIDRVTAPLTADHVRRLEALQHALKRAGKLVEAQAVEAELKKGTPKEPLPPELVQRRNEYASAVRDAVTPVNASYLKKLEELKLRYTRARNLDGALVINGALDEARRVTSSDELTIVSASYGKLGTSRVVDVTADVKRAFASGQPTAKLTMRPSGLFGFDPAQNVKKQTKITYAVRGFQRSKTFAEGQTVNFREDLN